MKNYMLILLLAICPIASSEELRYQVGTVSIVENGERIEVRGDSIAEVEVLPGGRTWPWLRLDEAGNVFTGNIAFDAKTGKRQAAREPETILLSNGSSISATETGFRIAQGSKQCTLSSSKLGAPKNKTSLQALRDLNVNIAASKQSIIALVTQFGNDGNPSGYQVKRIDPATCVINAISHIGNPDLLIEVGTTSQGGWWITGSIEQTLLRSRDGKRWRSIKLPSGLSSLISSYVVDDNQIWLAGILGDMDEHPNLLIYSPDGGRNWTSLRKNDPLLAKVPVGWLEGQKRKAY